MSRSLSNKNILKNIETNKKLSNNILYSEETMDLEEMKKGYMEMGKLNLEIAQEYNECEFIDVDMYETWLCGV